MYVVVALIPFHLFGRLMEQIRRISFYAIGVSGAWSDCMLACIHEARIEKKSKISKYLKKISDTNYSSTTIYPIVSFILDFHVAIQTADASTAATRLDQAADISSTEMRPRRDFTVNRAYTL